MLLYRKDISQTGDEVTSTSSEFRLIKFRSEHNHTLMLTKDRLRLETIATPAASTLLGSCLSKPTPATGGLSAAVLGNSGQFSLAAEIMQ